MSDKAAEQAECGRGQNNEAAVARIQMALNEIEGPGAEPGSLLVRRQIRPVAAPPHEIADARQKLAGFKGLRQIIIRPRFQTEDPVDGRASCRDHDHGLCSPCGPQFPT